MTQKIKIPCVILAGGKSSRLGVDKTQIDFGGESLSKWVFTRLSHICENVYISAKKSDKWTFQAPFLIEKSRVFAPLIGMINAFEMLKAQEILFVSVDTPFVSKQTLWHIAHSNAPIAYAQSTKAHYLIAKWHICLLDALLAARKSKLYALRYIVESHPHISIPATEEECLNINTQEHYAEALKLLALGASNGR